MFSFWRLLDCIPTIFSSILLRYDISGYNTIIKRVNLSLKDEMPDGWRFVEHSDLCMSDYYFDKIHLVHSGYKKFISDFQMILSPDPMAVRNSLLTLQ